MALIRSIKLISAKGIKAAYFILFFIVNSTSPINSKKKVSIEAEIVVPEKKKTGVSSRKKRNKNLVSSSNFTRVARIKRSRSDPMVRMRGTASKAFSGMNETRNPNGK